MAGRPSAGERCNSVLRVDTLTADDVLRVDALTADDVLESTR